MTKIENIINIAFREITSKGYFDIEKGNAPIPAVFNKEMSVIPEEMTKYVNECGYGCCFVFSAYMLEILKKYNINAYMVTSIEGNGIRASVLYEDEGQMFIANPVEDIEYFTANNIKPADRSKFYEGDTCNITIDGKQHNDSRYTIEEFCDKYGQLWVLGKMDSDASMTLAEAMGKRLDNCIAPPEKANVEIKSFIR